MGPNRYKTKESHNHNKSIITSTMIEIVLILRNQRSRKSEKMGSNTFRNLNGVKLALTLSCRRLTKKRMKMAAGALAVQKTDGMKIY